MRRVLRIVLLVILAFLIFVTTRPSTFHVERSTTIAAPADSLFPHIANFHDWNVWSPWAKLDPNMKQEFGGVDGALGATYTWAGNAKVGAGRMTLTETRPSSKLAIKLEFLKPFAATNVATFSLVPDGASTTVTWAMDGPMNFMSKFMCIFVSMDKMVGSDFEKGLTSLKRLAEPVPGTR